MKAGTIAIAVGSALGGAALAIWWDASHPTSRPALGKQVREEFVPAQVLSLSDAMGNPIATLDVGEDHITMKFLTGGEPFVNVNMYKTGRSAIVIDGKDDSVTTLADDSSYQILDSRFKGRV